MTSLRVPSFWFVALVGLLVLVEGPAFAQVNPPATTQSPVSRFFVLSDLGERTADPIWQSELSAIADGGDGYLYTTSTAGGTRGYGTVFKFSTTDSKPPIVLYNFDLTHGAGPQGGLTRGRDGNFYGTTYKGGKYGVGTIFSITPTGALTVLWDFRNGKVVPVPVGRLPTEQEKLDAAGSYPVSAPVLVGDVWYGVTSSANNQQYGVVYQISGGQYHALYQFKAADVAANGNFAVGLSVGPGGSLFGTTLKGGLGWGTIFQVRGTGVSVLHKFDAASAQSMGVIQGQDGFLYGTAFKPNTSHGLVYRLKPQTQAYTVIHAFNGIDGSGPVAGLTQASDGMLYGVTKYGGVDGKGVVYRLKPDGGDFSVLFNFNQNNGRYAVSPMVEHPVAGSPFKNFYGVTYQGGAKDAGAVYHLNVREYPTPSHNSFYRGGTRAVSDAVVFVKKGVSAFQKDEKGREIPMDSKGVSVQLFCPRDPHIVQFVLRTSMGVDGTPATGPYATSWGTFEYGKWHTDAIGFPNAYYDQAPGASHESATTFVTIFDHPKATIYSANARGWQTIARDFAICNGKVMRVVNWAIGAAWNSAEGRLKEPEYANFSIEAPSATEDSTAWSDSKLQWINTQLKQDGYDPVP
ncbi:MAG: hypothetical protein IPO30_13915 [Hyphomonadaceae bacterium]|nr:hypothetical protein [Hyphomonadaceae bacterium]